jgi:hypothetical protein
MGGMRGAALALLMVAAVAARAAAQAPAPDAGAGEESTAASTHPSTPALDASKLGVSMSRIQKGLRLSEARERVSASPFKLEYQVQVYGTAPRIDILKGFNITPGAPVSYGAPTHSEFLNQWTPQEFRAPPANVGALAGWALFQLAKRADKSKCEQEIADYRALVMQGISAPAPRCTQ